MEFWTGFIVFGVIAVILWWALQSQIGAGDDVHGDHEETAVTQDDLTKIEGIGPKTQTAFYDAGVNTYADLAASTPEALDKITKAAGINAASEGSWPKQAKLAADGDWDGLKTLQDELVGGR